MVYLSTNSLFTVVQSKTLTLPWVRERLGIPNPPSRDEIEELNKQQQKPLQNTKPSKKKSPNVVRNIDRKMEDKGVLDDYYAQIDKANAQLKRYEEEFRKELENERNFRTKGKGALYMESLKQWINKMEENHN